MVVTFIIGVYLSLTQAPNAVDVWTFPVALLNAPTISSAPANNNNVSKEIVAVIPATLYSTAASVENFWIGVVGGLFVVAGMTLNVKD